MTMHEISPAEWSPDAYLDAMALRLNFQSLRLTAERSNALHLKSIEAGARSDPTRFVLDDFTHRVAPADLRQASRGPESAGQELIAGIFRMDIYYPAEDEKRKVQPKQGWWNDVFIELQRTNGTTERLLFNSTGLIGYATAGDIETNDIAEFTNDLFRVRPGRSRQPQISFQTFEEVFYEYSELVPLTSDGE